jgi:hypothetical protein
VAETGRELPGPAPAAPRSLVGGIRANARALVRAGIGAAVVLAVNVVVVLIAVPIGIYVGHLFWAVVIGEAALLVGCAVVALVAWLRGRRGLGPGLLAGWAAGYVGLLGVVVFIVIALIVIVLVVVVLSWLLAIFLALLGH